MGNYLIAWSGGGWLRYRWYPPGRRGLPAAVSLREPSGGWNGSGGGSGGGNGHAAIVLLLKEARMCAQAICFKYMAAAAGAAGEAGGSVRTRQAAAPRTAGGLALGQRQSDKIQVSQPPRAEQPLPVAAAAAAARADGAAGAAAWLQLAATRCTGWAQRFLADGGTAAVSGPPAVCLKRAFYPVRRAAAAAPGGGRSRV